MDPELRSFLEAMEQRANATMDAMRAEMDAMEQRAVARDAETRRFLGSQIDDARTETRALHEDTWKNIDALGEGLSTHQRGETGRIVADRERALLDEHIFPLEASNAIHEKRLKAVEVKVHQ